MKVSADIFIEKNDKLFLKYIYIYINWKGSWRGTKLDYLDWPDYKMYYTAILIKTVL